MSIPLNFSTKAKHSSQTDYFHNTYSIIYFRKEREANAQLGKQRFSKLLAPAEGVHNDNDDENENDNRTMAICLKTNTSNAATSFSSLLFGEDIKEDKGTVKEKKCTQVVN